MKDNTRIAGQVSSLLRTGISLEIETVLLPDAPDRNRMLLPLPALGGYPVHLLPQQFLASVLPGNPSLRLVRNLPLGRQPRSNSTRHKPSPNNEEEIRSLRPEDRMRTYPLEIPRLVAIELSKATASLILDLEAPRSTGGNPNVKLTIGIVSMLAAFPLFFPFVTRYLAIMLFLCGLIVYCSGLIENTSYARARKQAAAPKVTCRNCNSLTTATSQRCNYCGARLQED